MKDTDLARFRAAERQIRGNHSPESRFVHDDRFLRGPIPMRWLSAAASLPGKALHVALAIRVVQGLRKSSTGLRLTASILDGLAVNRYAKYRALQHLERAGLIAVSRGAGRKEVIAILLASPRAGQPGENP